MPGGRLLRSSGTALRGEDSGAKGCPRGSVVQASLGGEFRADPVDVGEREVSQGSVLLLHQAEEARCLGGS